MKVLIGVALSSLVCEISLNAIPITHTGEDLATASVAESMPWQVLEVGGSVGNSAIPWGVNYSFGGVEGIINDFPFAIAGANSLLEVDLVSSVSGQIVVLNSESQGLTSYIQVEAGFSDPGTLLLEVFDIAGNLVAFTYNTIDDGPNGRSLLTIDRAGIFDIASFVVTTPGQDDFAVTQVTIELPGAVTVPDAAPLCFPLALAFLVALRRRLKEPRSSSAISRKPQRWERRRSR
jgi:hypothetical protein